MTRECRILSKTENTNKRTHTNTQKIFIKLCAKKYFAIVFLLSFDFQPSPRKKITWKGPCHLLWEKKKPKNYQETCTRALLSSLMLCYHGYLGLVRASSLPSHNPEQKSTLTDDDSWKHFCVLPINMLVIATYCGKKALQQTTIHNHANQLLTATNQADRQLRLVLYSPWLTWWWHHHLQLLHLYWGPWRIFNFVSFFFFCIVAGTSL